MDPISIFVTSVAGGVFANYTTKAVDTLFRKAVELKPSLLDQIKSAKSSQDIERVFDDATGVIDANAGNGQINVDGGLLSAVRGIRFDHANGTVTIGNSTVAAPVLVTGGGQGATGNTTIEGNTSLKSAGTEIQVGRGASITMSGGASIKQG